jgi:hypothetical protein
MRAVLVAWKDVFGPQITPEQRASLQWTIDSVGSQFVHNSATEDDYQTSGTLFSGWRLTTFMNTALNFAYLYNCGIEDKMAYSLHNGDDVLASAKTMADIVDVLKTSEQLGLRAQVSKMNIGTIAEFLRMDFRAKVKSSKQYLTRAVSTYTHSRIESGSPSSQRDIQLSICTRHNEVLARGGSPQALNELTEAQHRGVVREFGSMDLSHELMTYDKVAGGANDTNIVTGMALTDTVVSQEDDIDLSLLHHGINDYMNYVVNKFPKLRDKSSFVKTEMSVRRSFNIVKTKMDRVQSSKREQRLWLSLKGIWRAHVNIGAFSKARMTAVDLFVALAAASPAHAAALMKAEDPYHLISILL